MNTEINNLTDTQVAAAYGQTATINSQSFLISSAVLEEIGNNLVKYAENIKSEMEKLNSEKTVLSSIRLEKSCDSVSKVGKDCLVIGDIAKDIGSIYDDVTEPSMGRSI